MILLEILKKILSKIILNLFFLILIIFMWNCSSKNSSFYIKASNDEEVKIGAFEICGRNFKIIAFEEDTALIVCSKEDVKD